MPATFSRRLVATTAGIIALAVLLAVLGSAALGRSGAPSASPTPSPSPTAPISSPEPSAPTDRPVVIEDPTGHDITVDVDDRSGAVTGVTSSRPTVGMSVRWSESIVENVDDRTIRITWAGYPRDEAVAMIVDEDPSGFSIRIGQGMPYPNTDAMGQDRILVIAFEEPVDAADVAVAIHPAESLGN